MTVKAVRAGLIAALALLSTACGGSGAESGDNGSGVDEDYVYGLLRDKAQMGSYGPLPRTILKALPGVEHDELVTQTYQSDLVVGGSVTDVVSGQSFVLDGTSDSPAPSGATDVDVTMMIVSMSVDDVICADMPVPEVVNFSFPVTSPEEAENLEDGFNAMGPIAVFLKKSTDPDDEVFGRSLLELLTAVDDDGGLAWPIAVDTFGPEYVEGGLSITDLRHACPT